MSDEDTRAAFEAWHRDKYNWCDMADEVCVTRYEAWQASREQAMTELGPWVQEGDRLFSNGFVSLSFHLGEWWADRPWRTKPSQPVKKSPD